MLSLQPLRVVTQDRDAFEDKKTKMAASHLSGSDVLKLNVRGTHFQTRRATGDPLCTGQSLCVS